MIWTLIQKEMLDQILSIRFSVSLILALLFLVPSTDMLATDYGGYHRGMEPLIKDEFFIGQGGWYTLNRSNPTLRVLATGLDQELSLRASSTATIGPAFENYKFIHNPLRYLFSQVDFVFFINIIGSLLAFAFTYDAISGERQQGTLRLMLTNPIPRPLLLLSKFLGCYFSFAISLLPALIGVILVLYLHPDVNFHAEDWGATCFLILIAMLYLIACFMLGLFVSCVTKNPKTTLTALLMLWALLVLVIPNFNPFLAVKLRPVRSVYAVEAQIALLGQDLRQRLNANKKASDFIQQHGRDWFALSDEEKDAVRLIWNKERRELMKLNIGEVAKIRSLFTNEVEEQAKLSQYLSLISPSAALTYLASDTARTGIESERHFRRAVFRYRRQYAEHLERYIEKTGDYSQLQNIDKNNVPPFEYRELSFSQAVAAHLLHVMVLVLYPILFFLGAQLAFIRSQL